MFVLVVVLWCFLVLIGLFLLDVDDIFDVDEFVDVVVGEFVIVVWFFDVVEWYVWVWVYGVVDCDWIGVEVVVCDWFGENEILGEDCGFEFEDWFVGDFDCFLYVSDG